MPWVSVVLPAPSWPMSKMRVPASIGPANSPPYCARFVSGVRDGAPFLRGHGDRVAQTGWGPGTARDCRAYAVRGRNAVQVIRFLLAAAHNDGWGRE